MLKMILDRELMKSFEKVFPCIDASPAHNSYGWYIVRVACIRLDDG